MNTKKSLLIIVGLLLVSFCIFSGSISVQAQSSYIFQQDLYRGLNDSMTQGEVSQLQKYLKDQGDLTYHSITGYFGSLTEQAVQKWQVRNSVVSSGSPYTTGYGRFGPLSRITYSRIANNSFTSNNDEDIDSGGSVLSTDSPQAEVSGDGVFIREEMYPATFLWAGAGGRGLTDEEFEYLDTLRPEIFIIELHHLANNRDAQAAEARKIRERYRNISIFVKSNISQRNDRERYRTDTFLDSFFLYDRWGNKVPRVIGGTRYGYHTDTSQRDYRDWLVEGVNDLLATDAFDGVLFDNATLPLAEARVTQESGSVSSWPTWKDLVGSRKRGFLNDGIGVILNRIKQANPDKLVLYNGLGLRTALVENRNRELLEYTDGVVNEVFCSGYRGNISLFTEEEIIENIELQEEIANSGKLVLQKSNHYGQLSGGAKSKRSRFCYAAFLLGFHPENTLFKFGNAYLLPNGELFEHAKESNIDLGKPLGPYKKIGDVFVRTFSQRTVVVNMQKKSKPFLPTVRYRIDSGKNAGDIIGPGAPLFVLAQDALFLEPLAPVVDVHANTQNGPVVIANGESIEIEWDVYGTATECTAAGAGGAWSGDKNTDGGSVVLGNRTKSLLYRISCTNEFGTSLDAVEVQIEGKAPARPFVDIRARGLDGPITIPKSPAYLTWEVYGRADKCIATGAGLAWRGKQSTRVGFVAPPGRTKSLTYKIRCENDSGVSRDDVRVEVTR